MTLCYNSLSLELSGIQDSNIGWARSRFSNAWAIVFFFPGVFLPSVWLRIESEAFQAIAERFLKSGVAVSHFFVPCFPLSTAQALTDAPFNPVWCVLDSGRMLATLWKPFLVPSLVIRFSLSQHLFPSFIFNHRRQSPFSSSCSWWPQKFLFFCFTS